MTSKFIDNIPAAKIKRTDKNSQTDKHVPIFFVTFVLDKRPAIFTNQPWNEYKVVMALLELLLVPLLLLLFLLPLPFLSPPPPPPPPPPSPPS